MLVNLFIEVNSFITTLQEKDLKMVGNTMIDIHYMVYPLFSLLTGILILIFPAILNYAVAFYLIIVGILGIVGKV